VPVFVGSALTVVVSVRDELIFITVNIKLIEVIYAFHARCAVNVVEPMSTLKALFASVVRVTYLAVLNPANWFAVVGLSVESSVAVAGSVEEKVRVGPALFTVVLLKSVQSPAFVAVFMTRSEEVG
jgi:hypothetical protein